MSILAVQGGAGTLAASAANGGGGANPLGGLNDAWSIGDTLTDNDKKLVGWDPSSGKINTMADILSMYRHQGQITGEVTPDFIDAIKTSLASTGGAPTNPALLMSKGASQSPLSAQTAAALFSIVGQHG